LETRGPKKPSTTVTPVPYTSQRDKLRTIKCYDEVEKMLSQGIATPVVARFIHDKGELKEMSVESLGSRLRQWRTNLPVATKLAEQAPRVLSDAIQQLNTNMNESAALRELLKVQMERVQQGREQEVQDQRLSAQTGREIELAATIISQHAKIRVDLGLPKLEMGVDPDAQAETDLEKLYGDAGGAVRRVLADPASRRRVFGLVERVTALAGAGHSLPSSIDGQEVPEGDSDYSKAVEDAGDAPEILAAGQ